MTKLDLLLHIDVNSHDFQKKVKKSHRKTIRIFREFAGVSGRTEENPLSPNLLDAVGVSVFLQLCC